MSRSTSSRARDDDQDNQTQTSTDYGLEGEEKEQEESQKCETQTLVSSSSAMCDWAALATAVDSTASHLSRVHVHDASAPKQLVVALIAALATERALRRARHTAALHSGTPALVGSVRP